MKTILTTLLLGLASLCLTAQTTLEEYNYITKGYKIQLENGLDMKKGYAVVGFFGEAVGDRAMLYNGLYRLDANGKPATLAAVMVIFQRPSTSFIDYICIPLFGSDKALWDMYFEKIAGSGSVYTSAAVAALSLGNARCAAYFFDSSKPQTQGAPAGGAGKPSSKN